MIFQGHQAFCLKDGKERASSLILCAARPKILTISPSATNQLAPKIKLSPTMYFWRITKGDRALSQTLHAPSDCLSRAILALWSESVLRYVCRALSLPSTTKFDIVLLARYRTGVSQ